MNRSNETRQTLWTMNFVLLCFSSIAFFLSFYYLLPTLPIYVRMWGGKDEQIGLIIGVFAFSSLVLRPFLGHLVDTRGRKWMIVLGAVIFLVSSSLYYFAHVVITLLAIRVLHGAGMALYNTSATTLAADCAPENRRGTAIGIYGTFMNLAMAVGPVIGGVIVAGVNPLLGPTPGSVAAFSTLFLISAVTALTSVLLSLPIRDVVPVEHRSASPKMVLFSKEAAFPGVVMLSITVTYGTLISFLPGLADDRNLGQPGYFFTLFAIVLMITRVIAGSVSDWRGRGAVIAPGLLFVVAAMVVIAFAKSQLMLLLSGALYGVGMASTQPALTALAVDRADPGRRGAAMGTFTAAFELGLGGGAILSGMLLARTNYTVTFLATAATALIGFIIFIAGSAKGKEFKTQRI